MCDSVDQHLGAALAGALGQRREQRRGLGVASGGKQRTSGGQPQQQAGLRHALLAEEVALRDVPQALTGGLQRGLRVTDAPVLLVLLEEHVGGGQPACGAVHAAMEAGQQLLWR